MAEIADKKGRRNLIFLGRKLLEKITNLYSCDTFAIIKNLPTLDEKANVIDMTLT